MVKEVQHLESDISPRSTIVLNVALMTSTLAPMNESNMAPDVVGSKEDSRAIPTPKETLKDVPVGIKPNPASPTASFKNSLSGGQEPVSKSTDKVLASEEFYPPTPTPHEYVMAPNHGYPISLTPQPGSVYHYLGYAQQHVTPEPPSPAGQHSVVDVYNVGTFFHQHQTGVFGTPTQPSPFTLSPPRGMPASVSMDNGNLLPPSPLFPRATSTGGTLEAASQQRLGTPSPNLPYMVSSQHSFTGAMSRANDDGSWSGASNERLQPNSFTAPQLPGTGVPLPHGRTSVGGRTYSFDETMLSASVASQQDPAYSPYSTSQTSPGGTIFAHPSWGYGPPEGMYNPPVSPLQQRAQSQIPLYPGMPGGGMRPMGSYGQFFPASSPGPPIQTTPSNKGPDGANLFVFHIPNHFTNLDMYQLFYAYGNLLSVRIMVEKGTGRSRGFGFVSYDTPESAALAIKGLNGFAVGNKRLKVQHKQLRQKDSHDRDSPEPYLGSELGYEQNQFSTQMPPTGVNANPNFWSDPEADIGENMNQTIINEKYPNQELELSLVAVDASEEQSPLSTLSQIQNALPDISGNDLKEK